MVWSTPQRNLEIIWIYLIISERGISEEIFLRISQKKFSGRNSSESNLKIMEFSWVPWCYTLFYKKGSIFMFFGKTLFVLPRFYKGFCDIFKICCFVIRFQWVFIRFPYGNFFGTRSRGTSVVFWKSSCLFLVF